MGGVPSKPDVVALADMVPCGMAGCGGRLCWNNRRSRGIPIHYQMICEECEATNLFVEDTESGVLQVRCVKVTPKEPEPEPVKPKAPDDLMEAAKLLALHLNKKVYVTCKSGGGIIKIPGDYWGISLVQDMYDGCYCIDPDGKFGYTEQYT